MCIAYRFFLLVPYPPTHVMASPYLSYCFSYTMGELRVDPPALGHELGAPVTSFLFCARTTLRIAGPRPGGWVLGAAL